MKTKWMSTLRSIFLEAVRAVQPKQLFSNVDKYDLRPQLNGNQLNIKIEGELFDITNKRCHIVGFGKGVLGMAVQMERALGDVLTSGILSIPKGSQQHFQGIEEYQLKRDSVLKVFEGAENNQPDEVAMQAAIEIKSLATSMTANDVLFVLITGGGSALLPLPKPPLTLKEKTLLIKQLSHQGATIDEINSVRIALSAIKGGRLSLAASKAHAIVSFIISDVVHNPLHLIASGPTWKAAASINNSQSVLAKMALEKYQMWSSLPENIKQLFSEKDPDIGPNQNTICLIGHNGIAAKAAAKAALTFDYVSFVMSVSEEGNICLCVDSYIRFVKVVNSFWKGHLSEEEFLKQVQLQAAIVYGLNGAISRCKQYKKPLLLIWGAETTVLVKGSGLGGRNQELALRLSIEFHKSAGLQNVWFLSAGTDGIDGPTDAAGAFANSSIIQEFYESHTEEELERYLKENDSYNFYKKLNSGEYHLITGHTGTNVMDLHFFLFT